MSRNHVLSRVRDWVGSNPRPKGIKYPYAIPTLGVEEMVALVDAALDWWWTDGPRCRELEKQLSAWIGGARKAVLCNSGSSANLLALAMLIENGLRRGDQVVTTAAGFPTTVAPIVQLGLVPVFVDINLTTLQADPEAVADAAPKAKAVFLPHTLGNPFDAAIEDICQDHELRLLEDCCDALGSRTAQGYHVGTRGDAATASFYMAHHLTCGEGGAVFCSAEDEHIVRSLRDWGRACRCVAGKPNACGDRFAGQYGTLPKGYDHRFVYDRLGYNLKMLDLQAAVGLVQIRQLDRFIKARRRNWKVLREELEGVPGLLLHEATRGTLPSWFGFPITVTNRPALTRALLAKGVDSRVLFGGNLLRQPGFQGINCVVPKPLSNTDRVCEGTFFVGCHPGLSEEDCRDMAGVIRECALSV